MEINSKVGIAEAIKTLEGFDELRRLRRKAHYEDGHILSPFVVFGRWSLDNCGNCMGAQEPFDVDPVLTMDEFMEALKAIKGEESSVGFGIPTSIPADREICAVCGRSWSTVNIHDCYRTHQGTVYHARCYRIHLANETRESFEAAFEIAGETPAFFEPIPNGYYPDPNAIFYTKWYTVTTPLGQFKVGWRKRVIHLELLDPEIDIADLFPDESTTKWKEGIHCWGYVKMAEYIKKIAYTLLEAKRDRLWPERVERRERYARERAEKEETRHGGNETETEKTPS
jgi:hypothetical protein